MTRKRNERSDYRHFPPEYVELLQRFDRTGSIRFGPMTERQANSMRREWYRYASFLRNADPTDDYARSLSAIAANMVWSVGRDHASQDKKVSILGMPVIVRNTDPDADDYFLNAYLNPIVAAVRRTTHAITEVKDYDRATKTLTIVVDPKPIGD
jgi:hypothetical protein